MINALKLLSIYDKRLSILIEFLGNKIFYKTNTHSERTSRLLTKSVVIKRDAFLRVHQT